MLKVYVILAQLAHLTYSHRCDPDPCPMESPYQLRWLPVPWNCSQYISCEANFAYLRACNFGLQFDVELKTCMPPVQAVCRNCGPLIDWTPPSHIIANDNAPWPNQNTISSTTVASHNDGHIITTTKSNYVQPTTHNKLNFIERISNRTEICGNKSVTPVTCFGIPTNGSFLRHPDNCELFYYCISSNATPNCRSCPVRMHFNPVKLVCQNPDEAGCKSEVKGNVITNIACNTILEDVSYADLRPDEDDCSRYYVCDGGFLIHMHCPKGQHFNPKLKVCDYPGNAGCSIVTNH